MPSGIMLEDWRDFLNPAPVSNFQERISIASTNGYLQIIGYISRIDTKGESNFGGTPDRIFADFLRTRPPPEADLNKYCITKDTHYNTNLSVLKYDKKPFKVEELDQDLIKSALDDTIQWYSFLKDSCRILEWEELEYVTDTSPGFKYKVAGCSTKEEAVDRFKHQIKEAWDTHHIKRVPCLWKQAGKVELLKREKVECGDLRGFTCPELDFYFCCLRMNADFNKKLHEFAAEFKLTMSRVGYVLQKGGFTKLFNYHNRPDSDLAEGDCDKYDSNIAEFLFWVSMMVRYSTWDKKGMSKEEWFLRQKWYFHNKVYSFIVLPSGQVVLTCTGNKSGQDSTTDDNGIFHTFTKCYGFRKLYGKSLWDHKDKILISLYADDHIETVHDMFKKFALFECRRKFYGELGLVLSEKKDLVTRSPEGHTFLGPKATMKNGRIVPIYPRDKALCSVLNMEHAYPLDAQIGRVLSIMVNVVFDRPLFDYLRSYVYYLLNLTDGKITLPLDASEPSHKEWLKRIPGAEEAERFWLGDE